MSAIILEASDTSAGTIGEEAMVLPAQGATLNWYFGAEFGTNYRPYLVRAISLDVNDNLEFRGINLANRTIEIGPTSTTDSYSVNLNDRDDVYRDLPSTTLNLAPNGTKQYAVLFLTDKFTDYSPTARLAPATTVGGPKYPQSAEALFAIRVELQQLTDKYNKAWSALQAISSSNKSAEAPLNRWLEEFAP